MEGEAKGQREGRVAAELEVVSGLPALGGAGEEAPLKPRGLAPKRMREKQAGGTKRRGGRVVQPRQEGRRGGRGRGVHYRSRQVESGIWKGSAPALVAISQWLAVMQWVQWSLRCGCRGQQAQRCGLE